MKKVPRHLYWSTRELETVDLDDPKQKRWWVQQVLTHGTKKDVCELDLQDIKRYLPELHLPKAVRALWSDYLASRNPQRLPPPGA